jgi:mRNA interferase MazF
MVARYEIWLVWLDPGEGAEIRKTRPAVVVSPNEMNDALKTVLMCPMTSTRRGWPTRVESSFQGKFGEIAIDQMRAVDRKRLVKKLGETDAPTKTALTSRLLEIFAA